MNPMAMLGGGGMTGSPMGGMQNQPGGMDIAAMLQQLQNPMALASAGGGQPPMDPQTQAMLLALTKGGQTQVQPQQQNGIFQLLQQLMGGGGVQGDRPQPGQGMPQGAGGNAALPPMGMGGGMPMGM